MTSTIPTEKAYELLNLPLGSSKDAIEQSYKKLAFKWHPEKYATTKNTQEALKKFKSINLAYRKLIHNDRDDKDITLTEMFEQYRQVFHNDNKKKEKLLNSMSNNGQTYFDIKSNTDNNNNNNNNNQTIEQNKKNSHLYGNDAIIKNNSKIKSIHDKNNNNDEENYENQYQSLRKDDQIDQNILSLKLKVKQLAIKGVELAKQNEFSKAIEKFTEAIRSDSTDHRLYGNRSYCFDKINNFQDALHDAEKAIALDPLWPKGYFRKGRALYGLKMYKDAEEAYIKVLEIENPDDPELDEELFKVRALQLQEMGFSKAQSESAIKNYVTVQASLESLFFYNNKNDKSNESCSDIDNNEYDYNENDSEYGDENSNSNNSNGLNKKFQTNLNINSNNKLKSITNGNSINKKSNNINDSSNNNNSSNSSSSSQNYDLLGSSNGLLNNENRPGNYGQPSTSLWIGNVDPNVSEETLTSMFSNYGPLTNVRCLPEKYCAFVNFKSKDDAHKALQNLQGKFLEGQKLLIKYPDNPNTALLSSLVLKKTSDTIKKSEPPTTIIQTTNTLSSVKLKLKKSDEMTTTSSSNKNESVQTQNGMKLTGPVNGNECYFWRTTGCLYADKCRYEHIKKNKGCDKKPWHK